MDTNKLKFYLVLSRLPFLQESYSLKILTVALVGFLVPLLTLIIYLVVTSSLSFGDKVSLFLIVLCATVVGAIASLYLLLLLLFPIILTSKSLYRFLNDEQKAKLPTGLEDCVGKLMTNVQYTIEKLDLLSHSLNCSCVIDPLTGISNRRAAEERLRQDIARARREKKNMLIALLDIDQLKSINHKFGHHLGDVCLTQIALTLSKNIREGDWVARWSGNQFLMVLWNFNYNNPLVVLERIQQQSVKIHLGELLQISLSIGAYEYHGEKGVDTDTDLKNLLIQLGSALSQVKNAGCGGIIST
jgi:diguanylate cyclase (GGDEF)-like protein